MSQPGADQRVSVLACLPGVIEDLAQDGPQHRGHRPDGLDRVGLAPQPVQAVGSLHDRPGVDRDACEVHAPGTDLFLVEFVGGDGHVVAQCAQAAAEGQQWSDVTECPDAQESDAHRPACPALRCRYVGHSLLISVEESSSVLRSGWQTSNSSTGPIEIVNRFARRTASRREHPWPQDPIMATLWPPDGYW